MTLAGAPVEQPLGDHAIAPAAIQLPVPPMDADFLDTEPFQHHLLERSIDLPRSAFCSPASASWINAIHFRASLTARIFGDWQRIRYAAGGRDHDIAAPQIAAEQVAGAGLALMKPFEPRCPGA